MYQLIGISAVLRAYAFATAILAVGLVTNAWGYVPALARIPLNQISAVVLFVTAVVGIAGSTWVFPLLCRFFLWRLFPCLDGEYTVEVSSNWSLVSRRVGVDSAQDDQTSDDQGMLFKKVGKATIKARLLSIYLKLDMDDGYSSSHTVACSATPSVGDVDPTLYYVYQNHTPVPKETDSEYHFGAARLSIPRQRCPTVLEGTYWTDRNWHRGLNTAGRIRLTALKH